MDDPFRAMRPVDRNIPEALKEGKRPGVHRRFDLRRKQVNSGPREVWQPAGMIQMKMGQHNMPDIPRSEAQPCDLPSCRFLDVAGDSVQSTERAYPPCWADAVLESEACVHQHKLIRLNEQAVSHAGIS